ncbi:protein ALWAYS EARLY 3-like isoform X2 [Phragmites australis]|uniref:protein ALWAYS EARLY 3-like isoform X2 n=1 Tax=Phragmites australis TaxID=29695 RepID=UPI002D780183|nr:protein ALWAYS EARLY 3-like isoform X2 [Phragmites australis]
MGPAKGSRMINKTIIKGYEDQLQHEDPSSSSKAKQKKRKISDLDPEWSKDELTHFYEAYRRHGKDWKKISLVVGGKSSDKVRSLYSMHRDESTSHRVGDQMVRASGKSQKCREATQQKANEGPHPHNSCHEGTISGFSSSFKKRYYGELVRNSRNHAVGKRTPLIPIIVPADRNTTDDATPEIESVVNPTKRKYEEMNNDCTNFPKNESSPDGSSGITEANKADQGQTFLETKGTGDTTICQSQPRLKTIRIQQTMDEGQTGKVEHETMIAAKEGNKLVDSLNQYQILREFISEEDLLVLDVLQSLVDAPSKMSKLKINIPSGSLGKNDSAISHRMGEGHSTIDLNPKQGKPVGKSSASKTRQKRQKKLLDAEVPAGVQNMSVNKVLPEAHRVGVTEDSSLCSDSGRGVLLESSADITAEVYPNAPTEIKPEIRMSRTKRKSKIHCKTKHVSCNEGSDNLQARKLLHCLSSESLRRWCAYEWFYSAVDYPWFLNNEFVHYLNHANFSHLSRLTRSEWSTIRSSLGKPRRFSDHFLAVEKEKLEDYREKVRKIYAQLSDGSRDSLPADLARPFSIGQQVIVRHPRSRELCDGKVVMMGRAFYKVHFGNPDLGVALVKDTDCMPVNWWYNCPDNMKTSYLLSNTYSTLDMEHIPELTTSENWDHTVNGVTVPVPKSLRLTSDKKLKVESAVNSERPPCRSTSDGTVKFRGRPDNNVGNNDGLESYISAFVQRSLSQARQMVDEVMKANSEGSEDEEVSTLNQATDCIGPESEAAVRDAQLPFNLISNCIATVLSIKRLSDSRHPPANIAGVLERASSMLRPSCPGNLTIYKDIESYLSVIANQILALVPTTLSNGPAVSPL